MKHLLLLLVLLSGILLVSCKKTIQNKEEKAVITDVTNGLWYVTHFEQDDSDITAAFSGYLFKFNTNNTVTGILNNTDSVQGDWLVNINARTITSDFPSAGYPLNRLNETWYVDDSYTDSVSAQWTDTATNMSNYLQLKKQ
jgi:hypothetical protein